MQPLSLYERANLHNAAFPDSDPVFYHNEMLYANWFLGGGNVSSYYGSYQLNYLARIESMFPDATKTLHLFAGSMPPSDKYVRVGYDNTGEYVPDIVGNAENLSSFLPFKPDLIYADPPYSVEDAEHYKTGLVNRPRVVEECGTVLQRGGYLVWLDQVLPVFSNKLLNMVGRIGCIRSTGNRFRCVTIFRKV